MLAKIVKQKDTLILLLIIFLFVIVYSFIAWEKHQHFQTFGWDTAVFDQQAYFISNFRAPYTSMVKMNGLGDHFHIIFLILGGIGYKIWSNPEMLFIIQSIVACLSALPLYLITKIILSKTKLSNLQIKILGILISIVYLSSVSFQGMILDEFHNDPLATLPLLFLIYFLIVKNSRGYWLSFLILLLTKETYGLFSVPLGLYVFLISKDYKKAFLTALLGAISFYILLYLVMPRIAGLPEYFHFADTNRPTQLIPHLLQNPSLIVNDLINSPDKRETIVYSLFQFGFFSLFYPAGLIMPLISLAIRFYDQSTPLLYQFNNHYSAPLIAFLALATSFGVLKFIKLLEDKKIDKDKIFIGIFIYFVLIILVQDLLLHGPVNSLLKRDFYKKEDWQKDANELIDQVPKRATLASQNSLLPHLSQRDDFYLLPEYGDAEYIAVDLSDGPNKFAPVNLEQTKTLVDNLVAQKKFRIVWQKNKSLLLRKN